MKIDPEDEELSNVIIDFTNKVLRIADKHGKDRNTLMNIATRTLILACSTTDFTELDVWELERWCK